MPDTVRKAQYFKTTVTNKPGEGVKVLDALRGAGVNLLAFHGFPRGRKAQLDFVPEDPIAFRTTARQAGVKLEGPKTCFLVQGDDRPGALADALDKLAAAGISITASTGVTAGGGRWAAILWVDPKAVAKASKAFGIS